MSNFNKGMSKHDPERGKVPRAKVEDGSNPKVDDEGNQDY